MRKTTLLLCALVPTLTACDKHDPVLPGERSAIFETAPITMLETNVPNLPENLEPATETDCPYKLDATNTIWNGERKIFSGFATTNSVDGQRHTVCKDNFVYAGLSTGELVKVNAKKRQIVWIADIFRPSNMTGGASVLDIVAPIQIHQDYIYAGGLGGAFCKVSDKKGEKIWCLDINVEKPFIITNNVGFVLDTDKNLYAIRLVDGSVYWKSAVEKSRTPKYESKTIIVGKESFNAETGKRIE
ncbi:MAG: PQQ-like beta-propeller repeat protein [Alphaproteobacteria bacterium]|nr:PQQ-like beta-propeller repeat protein [Alphaproteobacteria bacterium]